MSILISALASGSRGNTTYVRTDGARLLIDAGLSWKEIGKRLETIGESADRLDAILVTHEHTDHSAGLPTLLKELSTAAYMTPGTLEALRADRYDLNGSALVRVMPGCIYTVGDVEFTPFRVPHDAAEPVAYSLACHGVKVTQATDLGHISRPVADQLRGSDVLILESNHDLDMLRVGPYPWNLKMRLMSRFGHLSNTEVCRFFREDYDGRAWHVILGHISSKNNHPEVVRQEARHALESRGFGTAGLRVTLQDRPSEPIVM